MKNKSTNNMQSSQGSARSTTSESIIQENLGKINYYSRIVFDLPLATLIILCFSAGIIIGAVTYSFLNQREKKAIVTELSSFSSVHSSQLTNDVADFMNAMKVDEALFSVFYSYNTSEGASITPRMFMDFMNHSSILKAGFSDFTWIPRVKASEKDAYVQYMRQFADIEPFGQFDIFRLDDTPKQNPLPSNYHNGRDFYPLALMYPIAPTAIFRDMRTDPERNATLHKAIATGELTMTTWVKLARPGSPVAFQIYTTVWPVGSTEHSGAIRGVFQLKQLMEKLRISELSCYVSIFDESDDAVAKGKDFIYSTLPGVNSTATKDKVFHAPYVQLQTVPIADRTWSLYYTPKGSFYTSIKQNHSSKFVAVFVSMLSGAVISSVLLVLLVLKNIILSSFVRAAATEKRILQDQSKKLGLLLDRIAQEEHRFRGIMNAVPYAIIVVDRDNIFHDCNKFFMQKFGYTKQVFMDMNFTDLFTEHSDVMTLFHSCETTIITNIKSNFGYNVEVEISVSRLMSKDRIDLEDNMFIINIHATSQSSLTTTTEKPSFVSEEDRRDSEAFHHTINTADLRAKFKEFCRIHHNEESILFIEAIQEYKQTTQTSERAKMQKKIFSTFLTLNAKYELNVAQAMIKNELTTLKNGLGQLDTFDNLYNHICAHLRQDSYQLYKKSLVEQQQALTEYL